MQILCLICKDTWQVLESICKRTQPGESTIKSTRVSDLPLWKRRKSSDTYIAINYPIPWAIWTMVVLFPYWEAYSFLNSMLENTEFSCFTKAEYNI